MRNYGVWHYNSNTGEMTQGCDDKYFQFEERDLEEIRQLEAEVREAEKRLKKAKRKLAERIVDEIL